MERLWFAAKATIPPDPMRNELPPLAICWKRPARWPFWFVLYDFPEIHTCLLTNTPLTLFSLSGFHRTYVDKFFTPDSTD